MHVKNLAFGTVLGMWIAGVWNFGSEAWRSG